MPLQFTVAGRIARPVTEVYEAVVDPNQLSRYFTTGGAKGRIEVGATVTWNFADHPGAFPVEVLEAVPNDRIVLRWAADGGDTTATMTFETLDGDRTLVTISESGWSDDEPGRTASYGNCEGWTQMLCSAKAWIEHGINLRDGFYA